MPSAPIIWGKQHSRKSLRAIVVNSGNANAHTGSQGIKIINEYVDFLSKKLIVKKSSFGLIN